MLNLLSSLIFKPTLQLVEPDLSLYLYIKSTLQSSQREKKREIFSPSLNIRTRLHVQEGVREVQFFVINCVWVSKGVYNVLPTLTIALRFIELNA